jgi:3-oxoacyl-(acyl-carrier-protein) synthase III
LPDSFIPVEVCAFFKTKRPIFIQSIPMSEYVAVIPVPAMGATVHEMTLIDMLVKEGDHVSKGQIMAELESDKSAFEYEAPADGTIVKLEVRAGDIITVGKTFFLLRTGDESLRHLEQQLTDEEPASPTPSTKQPAPTRKSSAKEQAPEAQRPAAPEKSPVVADGGPRFTPKALRLLSEHRISPGEFPLQQGSGPGGRISGEDVQGYLDKGTHTTTSSNNKPLEPISLMSETVQVAGIGHAVPKGIRSNRDILQAFPDMTEEEIIKITGIRQRHYAGVEESATSLGAEASLKAMRMAKVQPEDIDGILLATILPDQPVPSAASGLAKFLGIQRAFTFDLNAACSGWLYALEVGRALLHAGSAKCLLVVTAELLSRITNPKDHKTAFLFGDGAGAAVLTLQTGGHRLHRMPLSGNSDFFHAIERTGGGARMLVPNPACDDLTSFYLSMDGATVFKNAVVAFSNIIEETLARHQMSPDDVAWIVPHQANERILKAVSKRIGIPFERFVVTIGKYGNTSAASVSMALGWAAEEEIFSPGDNIIFCSVGAGFTYAGGLLVW